MISLDSALPEAVVVDGRAFPIVTDFRDWINFERLIFDASVPSEDKVLLMYQWFTDDAPESVEGGINALIDFYLCDRKPKPGAAGTGGVKTKKQRRISDIVHDAPYILASFEHAYRINLLTEEMHWWRFRALLENLPDGTKYEQILGYRSMEIGKLPKEQRAHYRKLKIAYALPSEHSYETLDERNRKWMEHAERINAEAHASAVGGLPALSESADDQ